MIYPLSKTSYRLSGKALFHMQYKITFKGHTYPERINPSHYLSNDAYYTSTLLSTKAVRYFHFSMPLANNARSKACLANTVSCASSSESILPICG